MKTNHPVQTRRREVLLAGAAGFALGVLPFAARTASGADAGLKIGTVGSGRIGGTLGELWLKAGHEVMFSSLDLEYDRKLAARLVRAFNAIGYSRMQVAGQSQGERIGMPIAGEDAGAIAVASRLVREVDYEPVLVGPLAMGRYLMPGTPLAGERTPEEIRKIAATLK